MVQLVAYEQTGTTQFELDVPDNPIELNFQYADLNDPLSRRSPYSFRFTLPLSKENNKFFSFYYDANVSLGTFNAMKKTECYLLTEGVMQMQGSLQMYSVSASGYEVSIMEQVSQVFDEVKGLRWPQLFITAAGTVDTDLDHALNWANVKNSWVATNDITTGAVGDGTIIYPLADGGQQADENMQNSVSGLGFYYSPSGGGMQDLNVLNLKPAIRIAYLLDYIFLKAGFTISSTWLNTADIQNIYMFLGLGTKRTQGRATYGFKVGIEQELLLITALASTWTPLPFYEESIDPFYDPDALVTNGVFVAPYEGSFLINTNVVITAAAAAGGYGVSTRTMVSGVPDGNDLYQGGNPYGATTIVATQRWLQLQAGDTVSIGIAVENVSADVTVNLSGADSVTFMELESFNTTGNFVDVSQNFPDVTVDEWLKAIVQRFNLVLISDPLTPGIIQMEPWSDYWAAGTAEKDWTEIVDQDSIKIESTLEYQKKTYEFTDAEGENFPNRWWQHQFGWIKGKYSYVNENDFVSAEEKTEEVFQPYRNRAIFPTPQNIEQTQIPNVLVPVFWDWNNGSGGSINIKDWVACKPVLAYYNGLQDIGNGATFSYGGVSGSTYPYFSEFNTVGVTVATNSLAWGYDYPDNFDSPFISQGGNLGGITLNYIFYKYWSRLFNEIYSVDSRVMTCKVNLNYSEISDLKFNDNIYLDGCFWKVLSIDNFSTSGETLANAKLIKVINKAQGRESQACGSKPCAFNYDGTVVFCDNVTGAVVSPTETCCTLSGYVWDEDDSKCFFKDPGGGGGGGGGGGNGGGGVGGPPKPPVSVVQSPNSYHDFSSSEVKSFVNQGVIGNNIKTNLQASTKSNVAVKAKTLEGVSDWTVPIDTVIYVRVQSVTVETGGTLGTVGNAVAQNIQATVANTRTSASSKSIARDVGVTTVIAENKDVAAKATITVSYLQTSDGSHATFSVECMGEIDIDAVWFIEMDITALQISGAGETMARPIIYNLDPNEVEFGDLTPDTPMYYNLPLI